MLQDDESLMFEAAAFGDKTPDLFLFRFYNGITAERVDKLFFVRSGVPYQTNTPKMMLDTELNGLHRISKGGGSRVGFQPCCIVAQVQFVFSMLNDNVHLSSQQ